ncbi:hypothetical protein [Treponema sp. Marseille-Q4130]|uniref:hypothetical protein n=1 Tax=Treponema sp. Marseille-Q4130 TaxID=2766702 RepID=UPI001652742D|nr:hypothetical protein [Treponema sp. Marseille-Q4130]MBC6719631.1 hypothetical protein [Treponema sp. Marseille-Q4130]
MCYDGFADSREKARDAIARPAHDLRRKPAAVAEARTTFIELLLKEQQSVEA